MFCIIFVSGIVMYCVFYTILRTCDVLHCCMMLYVSNILRWSLYGAPSLYELGQGLQWSCVGAFHSVSAQEDQLLQFSKVICSIPWEDYTFLRFAQWGLLWRIGSHQTSSACPSYCKTFLACISFMFCFQSYHVVSPAMAQLLTQFWRGACASLFPSSFHCFLCTRRLAPAQGASLPAREPHCLLHLTQPRYLVHVPQCLLGNLLAFRECIKKKTFFAALWFGGGWRNFRRDDLRAKGMHTPYPDTRIYLRLEPSKTLHLLGCAARHLWIFGSRSGTSKNTCTCAHPHMYR